MIGRQFLAFAAVALCSAAVGSARCKAEDGPPDFRFEIRPILAKNCFPCHGPDEEQRQAELRLDAREDAVEFGAIAPSAPDESEVFRRIASGDPSERMPPEESGLKLTAGEIEKIRQWISAGAEYSEHWSYVAPRRPETPEVSRPDWRRNEIDSFILARLNEAALAPEPEADKRRLIRRLSLDLTGLPPKPEEVDEFLRDSRPDAYERLVDRLLQSPAYGEHWARTWLDLARYADSTGYEKDSKRTIWPYRDWVINALNADMPFDRFTIEQLAGDLLPTPTTEQIIATAFHRNTMQNDEGGASDEEYRVAAVIDRVNTTMQVWMGVTMGCCQCHTHKYDPLTHREYYELFAYFNQTADADRYDQEPTLLTPTNQQRQLKEELDRALAENQREYEALVKSLAPAQREWEHSVVADLNWTIIVPTEVTSDARARFRISADGAVVVAGDVADSDAYVVRATSDLRQITALRLEALNHPSLPSEGPGRAANGGFAISNVTVHVEPIRPADNVKIVRIELPRHDYLKMAEVEVFRDGENIARSATATQSSVAYEGHAHLAIDGSTHPNFAMGRSISHTAFDNQPWWEADLVQPSRVDRIVLWSEEANAFRLSGAIVSLLDANRQTVWRHALRFAPNLRAEITVDHDLPQLAWAAADSERQGFAARHVIESNDPARHGWSPDPQAEGPHAITLGLEEPIESKSPIELRIVLDQRTPIDGRAVRLLGSFRLLATDDPNAAMAATVPQDIRAIARKSEDSRTPAEIGTIARYFQSIRPEFRELTAERENIQRRLEEEYRPDKTPIMKELPPEERRKTHVFVRGSFLDPAEEVEPDTPEIFPEFGDDLPKNRLGLAKWLVDRRNPLTARVVANRQWEQLFGSGIVSTSEDFGSQGTLPTHPELLDWLAAELMDNGWSLKRLTKTIVMSAAYRQSSRVSPEKLAVDPENRLISRGPRYRLTAEQIRDQALAVSGLLSRKLGGPSVMPPQPEGVWQVVYSDDRWVVSEGDDRYRRGLYTFWRRTSPYPAAMALDAPSREVCTPRRISTNTPIAAFALLNDPVYVEAAQALARLIEQQGDDAVTCATFAFERALARPPSSAELQSLVRLYDSELQHYRRNADAAMKMAASELGSPKAGAEVPELAAWTVVANVLLNLDETLSK